MYKVALWETTKYMRREGRQRHVSLYQKVENNDGDEALELQETIADDRAPDLDDWVDARTQLRRLPRLPLRLMDIVGKRMNKERLSVTEWSYLYDWRSRLREGLPTEAPQKIKKVRCPRCGRGVGGSMSPPGSIQGVFPIPEPGPGLAAPAHAWPQRKGGRRRQRVMLGGREFEPPHNLDECDTTIYYSVSAATQSAML